MVKQILIADFIWPVDCVGGGKERQVCSRRRGCMMTTSRGDFITAGW